MSIKKLTYKEIQQMAVKLKTLDKSKAENLGEFLGIRKAIDYLDSITYDVSFAKYELGKMQKEKGKDMSKVLKEVDAMMTEGFDVDMDKINKSLLSKIK